MSRMDRQDRWDGWDKIGKVGEEIDRKVTLVALRSFFVWEWGFGLLD